MAAAAEPSLPLRTGSPRALQHRSRGEGHTQIAEAGRVLSPRWLVRRQLPEW